MAVIILEFCGTWETYIEVKVVPDSKSNIYSIPCFDYINNIRPEFLPAFLPTSMLLQVRNLNKIQQVMPVEFSILTLLPFSEKIQYTVS